MCFPSPLCDHRHNDQVWLADGRESLRPPVGPVGGAGLPDPSGFYDNFFAISILVAGLRAPVLVVSRRSAPRSAALAKRCRQSAGDALDTTSSAEGKGPIYFPSLNGSALLEYGHPPGNGLGTQVQIRPARDCSIGPHWVEAARSTTCLWLQGRFFVRPVATLPLGPSGSLVPCFIPAHRHQPTVTCSPSDLPPAEIRCRISPFGQRSCEVPNDPLLLWLAVSKMLHRSLGRQGYGQPLSALAGLSSTPCSLTASGPARGSPRPCGHP
jgi:hypothetical protein